MIVLPDGSIRGSIGGGGLERHVIKDALELMKSGGTCSKIYNLAGARTGGKHSKTYDQAGSPSDGSHSKTGAPEDSRADGVGPICGGEATVFIEIVRAPETLLLCGGGHIASAIAPMAHLLGMDLIVVDNREEFATRERFPNALRVINAHPGDPEVQTLVTGSTSIVIFTHNHAYDKNALKNLIDTDAAYIGMIGSTSKVKEVLAGLEAEGVPAEALERVYSPVGLDIGAETPAEIAVSILAEIIHVRRTGSASAISMKSTTRSETAKR
jgi:xanthine dehydrogenase accessory factor